MKKEQMIKTNIKMRVTPEQSRKVQEICLENDIRWCNAYEGVQLIDKPFLFIDGYISFMYEGQSESFLQEENEEIDPELFIRTNGTCIEKREVSKMELKEMIKVMQHYDNGGDVELSSKRGSGYHWATVTSPSWDWDYFDYRIKEQKSKVTMEKWLCINNQGVYAVIESSNVDMYGVYERVKLMESYEIEL